MSEPATPEWPKLRLVDVQPSTYGGEEVLVVRDPLRLSDHAIVIPRQLAPLLALCDGTRDAGALRAVLMVRFGLQMGPDALERLLAALDQALLFEGERFQQALDHAQAEFRKAPFRSPALAGASYPADPADLRALLQQYLDGVDDALPPATGGRGLVSPHIDYARGGPLYARVWRRAAEMVRAADLVVILGTDHSGSPGRITLTRQHYATPFGVLPTAEGLVERLATALGPAQAFAEELHHRHEHSIELAAVWLHHMRQGQPCELLPVLCGSFAHFVRGEAESGDDPAIGAFCDELRQTLAGRNAVVVAAADLAHVGPAFSGEPVDIWSRARLHAADGEIMGHMCAGDAEGFFQAIRRAGDSWNVCGLPPIYMTLRTLAPVVGEQVGYERCPADDKGTSLVSICGIVFS